MSRAIEYDSLLTKKRRINITMPTEIIDELETLFPNIDRSNLLTRLALQVIEHHYRFRDNPDLMNLAANDQVAADDMWNYLEEIEHHEK